jgi:2-polyprenyl-3-methyl-5-hydroxy-6-metoxy-1,4-benzoquinol methylase
MSCGPDDQKAKKTEGNGSPARFDQAAATWDDNPNRVEMATAVAQAIAGAIPLTRQMQIMDFGSGTGLIARALAAKVASITAADTSSQMLTVLEAKAKAAGLTGIKPLLLDSAYESRGDVSYDAIVSSMVLHHVKDLAKLAEQLAKWCRPGGWVALADLEPEDGTFHRDDREVVHHGIDPKALASQFEAMGFTTQSIQTVHTIRRPPAGGAAPRDYPVFLLVTRKNR